MGRGSEGTKAVNYFYNKPIHDQDLNPMNNFEKIASSHMSIKKRWKQLHRRRLAVIQKSTLDPEIWEEFVRIIIATSFVSMIHSWNDFLSLIMVSKSTYQVLYPVYLRNLQKRPFFHYWFNRTLSSFHPNCPPSLEQKQKIALRSNQPPGGLLIAERSLYYNDPPDNMLPRNGIHAISHSELY